MSASQWELGLTVVERCACPTRGRVAEGAIRRETGLRVIRIRGPVEIPDMTRAAIIRHRVEVAVHMALGTRHTRVRSGQRERSLGVIERRALPIRGAVAQGTVGRKSSRLMIRIGGPVEIIQMAARAVGRRGRKRPADMALIAGQRGMCPRQRKLRGRMVERCVFPLRGVVALGAIRGEPRQLMIRICRVVEVCDVTGGAICRRPGEFSACVTLHAAHRHVRARQCERSAVVIKRRALPLLRGMANGAVLRITPLKVIRIIRRLIILEMATVAVRRRACELTVHMAGRTWHGCMSARQRERCVVVIKRRALPA